MDSTKLNNYPSAPTFNNRPIMPLLSIIVPVYNVERYLPACLDSILANKGDEIEIICIDDGSTDTSGYICDQYAELDSRITVIHQTNRGPSNVRNVGITTASGEWVSFVDSDDSITDDYLDAFLSFISSPCDLCIFSINLINSNGTLFKKILENKTYSGPLVIQKGILEMMTSDQNCEFPVFTWNKFFKRHILISNGILSTEGLNYREDELFFLDYIQHCNSVKTIDRALYNYKTSVSGSLSHKRKSPKTICSFASLLIEKSAFIKYEPLRVFEYDRAIDFVFNSIGIIPKPAVYKTVYSTLKMLTAPSRESSTKKGAFLHSVFKMPDAIAKIIVYIVLQFFSLRNRIHSTTQKTSVSEWN